MATKQNSDRANQALLYLINLKALVADAAGAFLIWRTLVTMKTPDEPSVALDEPTAAFFAFCFAPPGAVIEDCRRGDVSVSHVATNNSGSLHLVEAPSMADLKAAVLALNITFAPEHSNAAHTMAVKI